MEKEKKISKKSERNENCKLSRKIQALEQTISELESKLQIAESSISSLQTCLTSQKSQNQSLSEINNELIHSLSAQELKLKGIIKGNEQEVIWRQDKWVDDSVITAYFEAMANSAFGKRDDLIFLSPSETHWVKFNTPDAVKEEFHFLQSNHYKYIICCVNDALQPCTASAGSHWSFLFCDQTFNKAYHFDSDGTRNVESAKIISHNLGIENVVQVPCIQQKNSYECGLNVLVNAKHILNYFCLTSTFTTSIEDWLWNKSPSKSSTNVDTHMSDALPKKTSVNIHVQSKSSKDRKTLDNQWSVVKRGPKKKQETAQDQSITCSNKYDVFNRNNQVTEDTVKLRSSNNFNENRKTGGQNLPNNSKSEDNIEQVKQKNYINDIFNGKGSKYSWRRPSAESEYKANNAQSVLVIGDSIIKYIYNSRTEVKCFRGACAADIYAKIDNVAQNTIKPKVVFIHVGTNDLAKLRNPEDVMGSVKSVIKKAKLMFPRSSVIVNGIICRRNVPNYLRIWTNKNIRWLCKDIGVIFMDLDKHIDDTCLGMDGVHLNRKGNAVLNRYINRVISICERKCQHLLNNENKKDNETVTEDEIKHNQAKIMVTKSHMKNMFEKYINDTSVAFAHCASRDLDVEKNMSVGVATVFRRQFGRPLPSQCYDEHLACQELNSGPVVYTLLTKNEYFNKPQRNDYDLAFQRLAINFKKRDMKYLICSPMGCIHDRISLDHFVDNLIHFQRYTEAKIKVVVYNKDPDRILKNGLTGRSFLRKLQEVISMKMLEQENSLSDRTKNAKKPYVDGQSTFIESMSDFPPLRASSCIKSQAKIILYDQPDPQQTSDLQTRPLSQPSAVITSANSSLPSPGVEYISCQPSSGACEVNKKISEKINDSVTKFMSQNCSSSLANSCNVLDHQSPASLNSVGNVTPPIK